MNLGKAVGEGGRGAPIEDPAKIRHAMDVLQQGGTEFPIRVQGAHTLPYTSRVQHMDVPKGLLHLKLIRPLPHELAVGAIFEMLFAVGDYRFEAPIVFRGRESYLLYRFSIPARMTQSDRRTHKRYPFRPREKAYVLAQDAGLPGFGLAGPLVNLSQGGLAFRVDRVVRLDDHLRVTPGLGFFDKGKELPMLKIRDLPKHPLVEARGRIANAWERDGEIVLGIQFLDLKDAELRLIEEVLAIREQMQRAPSLGTPEPKEGRTRSGAAEPRTPASRVNPAGSQTPDALLRLGRRVTSLVLAMPPGSPREEVRRALETAGYQRLTPVDDLEAGLQLMRADQETAGRLLVLEAAEGVELPLASIQALQKELGELKELSVALIRAGGMPPDPEDALIRPLPWPGGDPAGWLPILDELAGLGPT